MITLTSEIDIPQSVLSDILITAVEGGIGYWARGYGYHWSDERPETTSITVVEFESAAEAFDLDIRYDFSELDDIVENGVHQLDGFKWHITTDVIETGIERILNNAGGNAPVGLSGRLFADVSNIDNADWDYDANDADIIVQMGLWGEVVYG